MSFVPASLPIRTAAHIVGMCDRDFRAKVLGNITLTDRGQVDRRSLEKFLGFEISAERYLAADRRRDSAREYQRQWRRDHAEAAHVGP